MKLHSLWLSLLAFVVFGCAMAQETAEIENVGGAQTSIHPAGLETAPAYFNYDNHYVGMENRRFVYTHFNTYVGKRITVDLHRSPEAPPVGVRFTLYEVLSNGSVIQRKSGKSLSGQVVYSFTSGGTGSYVLKLLSSSGHVDDLELNLS